MSIDALLAEAAGRHGLLRVSDAARHGVSRQWLDRLCQRGLLVLIDHGVYRVCGAPPTWTQRVLAACWRTGAGAVASHRTAAGLYDLRLARRSIIEVTVAKSTGARPKGVKVHETRSFVGADISRLGSVPVTSPERTVIDIASLGSAHRTEETLDDAVHRGLTTSRKVADRLGSMPTKGRVGARCLWELLAERTGDPDERANAWENRISRDIAAADLPPPVRQHKVIVDGFTSYLDFAWPEFMVAVECDSVAFHSSAVARRYDLDRQHRLETVGWRFKRILPSQHAHDPQGTVAQIKWLLHQQGLPQAF